MSAKSNAVWIMVLEIDACANTYPACGAPGPCSNAFDLVGTYNTCTDRCLYQCGVEKIVVTNCRIPPYLMGELGITQYHLNITGEPRHFPVEFTLGESYGRPATFSFAFSGRGKPNGLSTTNDLARLVDAQKYWNGRRLTTYYGRDGMALGEMDRNVFIVDNIIGPTGADYTHTVKARSPIKSISGVKCPSGKPMRDINGNVSKVQLGIALDGIPTEQAPNANPYLSIGTYLLQTPLLADMDIAPAQFRELSQATVWCVGTEALRVQPEEVDGGLNFKLLERSVCGSTLGPHKIGATLQPAFVIQPHEHVADVVLRILQHCADLEQTFLLCCDDAPQVVINMDSIEEFKCLFPEFVFNSTIAICKSTSADTMLDSLAASFGFGLIDDNGFITMRGMHPSTPATPVEVVTQPMVIKYSEASTFSQPISYAAINYQHTMADCTKGAFSKDNLIDNTIYTRDDLFKPACERHEQPEANIKGILAPWFDGSNYHLAWVQSMRYCHIYGQTAKKLALTLDFEEAERFDVGGLAKLNIDRNVGYTRTFKDQVWYVQSKRRVDNGKCTQICFVESPFSNIEPSFTCDFQLPQSYDPTDCFTPSDLIAVW